MAASDFDRDEWLLDQSLKETFPASDPITPARPGSLVGKRHATSRDAQEHSVSALAPWLMGALAGGVALGLLLRRRHRD